MIFALSPVRRTITCLGALALVGTFTAAPASGAAVAPVGSPATQTRPVTPVDAVDLARYSGRWLQLAAVPTSFSARCVRDTQADYTPLPDGLVRVVNTCVLADGSVTSIEGRARVVGPDSTGQLEVTFVQVAGQWVFEAAGDYWVIGLDEKSYGWAVVGGPERTSGFVLSRTPRLGARQIAQAVRVIVRNGYDPCDFEITATTGGVGTTRPLCEV